MDGGNNVVVVPLGKLLSGGSQDHGQTAFFIAEAEDGTLFKFTYPPAMSAYFHHAVDQILAKINEERKRNESGYIVYETIIKDVSQMGYGIDPARSTAVIHIEFADGTFQDAPVHRSRIDDLIRFLRDAKKVFDANQQ